VTPVHVSDRYSTDALPTGQYSCVAKLAVSGSRPRLRWYYWPDPLPRYVIAGTEYEGSWRRDESFTVDVPPGRVAVSAYYIPCHPIGRLAKRNLPFRRAEIEVDVPVGDATVALEFRPRPSLDAARQTVSEGRSGLVRARPICSQMRSRLGNLRPLTVDRLHAVRCA
jgi:hypothetical protein